MIPKWAPYNHILLLTPLTPLSLNHLFRQSDKRKYSLKSGVAGGALIRLLNFFAHIFNITLSNAESLTSRMEAILPSAPTDILLSLLRVFEMDYRVLMSMTFLKSVGGPVFQHQETPSMPQ
jgi:hypothetical protein